MEEDVAAATVAVVANEATSGKTSVPVVEGTPAEGEAAADVSMEEATPEPVGELQAAILLKAAPTEGTVVMAPEGGIVGEDDAPPTGGEHPTLEIASSPVGATVVLQGQHTRAG